MLLIKAVLDTTKASFAMEGIMLQKLMKRTSWMYL